MSNFLESFDNVSADIEYRVKGIIKKILSDGDSSKKRPVNMMIQIESSEKMCKMCSWDYSALSEFKKIYTDHVICEITFKASAYKDGLSFKVISIKPTTEKSKLPVEEEYNPENEMAGYKERILELEKQISNKSYIALIDNLILNNENFFTWRAAKSCHHAFNGGLIMHSFNVVINAMNLANTYSNIPDFKIDYDLLITGALLHDIGKLNEYTPAGEFSFEGELVSHLVVGVEMIDACCRELQIDSNAVDILKLKHIIVSHHGKFEFGSPNLPVLPEAFIVNMADSNDAKIESIIETLRRTNKGSLSDPIFGLDNSRVFKLY